MVLLNCKHNKLYLDILWALFIPSALIDYGKLLNYFTLCEITIAWSYTHIHVREFIKIVLVI